MNNLINLDSILNETILKKNIDIRILKSVDSTNEYCKRIIKNNKNIKNTILCLAEEQTCGRGKYDRKWISPYAENIYCSILHRITLSEQNKNNQNYSLLSILVGIASIEALEKYLLRNSDIFAKNLMLKWPNDIMYEDKKLAGILIENYFQNETKNLYLIIGIGINVNMSKNNDLNDTWTSIKLITDTTHNRNYILQELITEIINYLDKFFKNSIDIVENFNKKNYLKNKLMKITMPNKEIIFAKTASINDKCELIITTNDNIIYSLNSCDIEIYA